MNLSDILNILVHELSTAGSDSLDFISLFVMLPAIMVFMVAYAPLNAVQDNSTPSTNTLILGGINLSVDANKTVQNLVPNSDSMSADTLSFYLYTVAAVPSILFIMCFYPTVISSASLNAEMKYEILEPILLTPVKTSDFIIAKCLSCVLIPLFPAWVGLLLGCAILDFRAGSLGVFLPTTMWVVWFFAIAPLTILFSTLVEYSVSSFSKGGTLSMIMGLTTNPSIILSAMYMQGTTITLEPSNMLALVAGLVLIDIVMLIVCTHVFNREEITARMR